jgi:hypothetical protein
LSGGRGENLQGMAPFRGLPAAERFFHPTSANQLMTGCSNYKNLAA